MRRRLKGKLLGCLLGAALALGIGMHLLHGAQVKRSAGALLRQADQAEKAGRPDRALKYLGRYLAFVPGDLDALARYGLLLGAAADTDEARARAFDIFERVLWGRPERHDVRRQLVRLSLRQGRFADAGRHLQILHKTFPRDAELERLLGECEEGGRHYQKAADLFAGAIKHDPKEVTAYVRLAQLLRHRLDRPKQADAVLDDLVKANAASPQAYLARAGSRLARFHKDAPGLLEGAAGDVAQALKLAPDDADVLLAAAGLAATRSRLAPKGAAKPFADEARRHLEHGLRLHPKDERLYRLLAQVEVQDGEPMAAVRCLRRALDALPGSGPQRAELRWSIADLLLQQRPPDEAGTRQAAEIIARLDRQGFPRAELDYLRARIHFRKRKWLAAATLLEDARLHLRRSPRSALLARQADLLLGGCYREVGQADRQYAAYRRAAPGDPTDPAWVPAHAGMAEALAALEKFEDALELYRALAPRLPEARLEVAKLLVRITARLPKGQQNWSEVDKALDEAARIDPDAAEVPVLRAEALLLRSPDQPGPARDLLRRASAKDPRRVEFAVALAALADREGDPAAALASLEEAKRRLGDGVELRLAFARYWARRGGAEARRALVDLGRGMGRFPAGSQRQLLRVLAEAHAHVGDAAQAERLWRRLAAEQPDDLGVRLVLFDHALRAGREDAMRRALEDIRRVDGPGGTFADYGAACVLLWQAGQGNKQGLAKARALLAGVSNRRPAWGRVHLCLARIEELEGDRGAAVREYLRAIDLGERDPLALRRAAELLFERGRYFEADQVVRRLPDAALGGGLQRLAAVASLRSHDYDRALTLAERAVAARSKDYRDYIWLGQVLGAVPRRRADAEEMLRRAVRLAPAVPDTWLALVHHLARTDRSAAEGALREAESKLPQEKAALALAQGYEAIRNLDRARELYQAALAARPDDPTALRGAATFYVRTGQLASAMPYLRHLSGFKGKAQEDATWARITLAFVLAVGGDLHQSRQALELVAGAEGIDTAARQRAQARVLAARRNPADRRKAIDLLEPLDARLALSADDQFLLAGLYQSVGRWPKARQWLLNLVAADRENRLYLTHLVPGLLLHKEPDQAHFWLLRLEELEPGTLRTTELRALLLEQQGKASQAAALLRAYARGPEGRGRPAAELLRMAGVLEHMGQAATAEQMYRAYASAAGSADGLLVLAQYLGRQDRPAEALDLCERAAGSCSPEAVASASLSILHTAKATDGQRRRVASWLEEALRKRPASLVLCVHLAVLHNLEGRYQEAEALYRKALAADNRSVRAMALNNLAWLLALRGNQPAKALDLIGRALELVGPEPGLLDTRAVVYLKTGRSELAIRDLEAALGVTPTASAYFHLAQAQHLAKNRAAAATALRKARDMGLVADRIDPLERTAYERLQAELALR